MRAFIIGTILFLSACNSDTTTVQKVPYTDPAVTAKLNALTEALAAATHEDAQRFALLQVVGKVNGLRNAAGVSVADFGPCANMGTFQGRGGSDSSNPLASNFEIYLTCTGYTTSYNEATGLHDYPKYAAWSEPNCQGTMYIITDVPQDTMSLAALENGLVMLDPLNNVVVTTQQGSSPESVQIQSSSNLQASVACGGPSDIETRMVISTVPYTNQTGAAESLVPGSWTIASP